MTPGTGAGGGSGPVVAPCPTCGASVTSVEAPVMIEASGRPRVVWLEVCYCRCGTAFLPPDIERFLRDEGRGEEPPGGQIPTDEA